MASTRRTKTRCSQCQKAAGIFTCRGCKKDFCYSHVAEHRQQLNKQMDALTTSHDQLQQAIIEQGAQPNSHPLMKKIDEWEQQSIDKIHKAAENTRKELLIVIATYREKVSKNLTQLTQELGEARKEDDYVETDLNEWIHKLKELIDELNAAQTIDFNEENEGDALISKPFINNVSADCFDRTIGDIQVIENGQVVVHGQTNQYGSVLGRGEYSSGRHRFRFKIEQANSGGARDVIFGIISKTTSLDTLQYLKNNKKMHYNNYSGYGYNVNGNQNGLVYIISNNLYAGTGDIVQLLINCDQRQIQLTSEQTQQTQTHQINLTTCPFPWHFFVSLLYNNTSVRLYQEETSKESEKNCFWASDVDFGNLLL